MEIKRHAFCIDLAEISQIVLSDPGATLQILRLADREYGAIYERPIRIEDCISGLGLEACLEAAGQKPALRDLRDRAVLGAWSHSLQVAQVCKRLASATGCGIDSGEAYLVGLLHMLGQLPELLGWPAHDRDRHVDRGLRLARQWFLPVCVQQLFAEMRQPGKNARWVALLERAHRMAPALTQCATCQGPRPGLNGQS